jgi:hypothetical protein
MKQISAKISKFFCWKKPLKLPSFVPPSPLSLTPKKKKKKRKRKEKRKREKILPSRKYLPAERWKRGEKWMRANSSSIHQLHELSVSVRFGVV